ncbi:MAG: MFS transporter [Planctomycetes bacterium]|nr:MFS transporter [Planctomycetota bacterium]
MSTENRDMKLFLTCFIALIATSFGFIVRVSIMDDWAKQFNLSETQKGEIFGVGLWPFAISIVLFSLIVDKIGYRVAMIFAFACHAAFVAIVIAAPTLVEGGMSGYWVLYLGSFIGALGNGTVEAVINPVVATMFSREKTKWLNILHAGWPGGLVLGGVLAVALGDADWRFKVALVGLPVLIYGTLMLSCKFPVNERVTAGVSFRDMLKEVGFFGALLITTLIVFELANVLDKFGVKIGSNATAFSLGSVAISEATAIRFGISVVLSLAFGAYTMSLGRLMFVFLMVIMMPLAITELGTDSWIGDLMTPEMKKLGLPGATVLIYTSFIMMVLRFCAGPIVHKLSPLGLLAASSAIAIAGLFFLSAATGAMILVAATLYGLGKTFFWPTMLGVVSERFPKGGALTLNTISGLGMLAVGILGAPLLGNVQDREADKELAAKHGALHAKVMGETKTSVFGEYKPVDDAKLKTATDDEKKTIKDTQEAAKKTALQTVALFPVVMLVCYAILIVYFMSQGGYKPVHLTDESAPPNEEEKTW